MTCATNALGTIGCRSDKLGVGGILCGWIRNAFERIGNVVLRSRVGTATLPINKEVSLSGTHPSLRV